MSERLIAKHSVPFEFETDRDDAKDTFRLCFQFPRNIIPEFLASVTFQNDDSFDCELRNPAGQFSIWIATYNTEITFGLKSPTGDTDIHSHVSCYEEDDIDTCFSFLTDLIDEIRNNQVILYKNEADTRDWIDLKSLEENENKKRLNLEKIFWDESKVQTGASDALQKPKPS